MQPRVKQRTSLHQQTHLTTESCRVATEIPDTSFPLIFTLIYQENSFKGNKQTKVVIRYPDVVQGY